MTFPSMSWQAYSLHLTSKMQAISIFNLFKTALFNANTRVHTISKECADLLCLCLRCSLLSKGLAEAPLPRSRASAAGCTGLEVFEEGFRDLGMFPSEMLVNPLPATGLSYQLRILQIEVLLLILSCQAGICKRPK